MDDDIGDEVITEKWIRDHMEGANSANMPKGSMEMLDSIKSRLCEKATVEFATCYSGDGPEGQYLSEALNKFFGENVQVILYKNLLAYYFNKVFFGKKL